MELDVGRLYEQGPRPADVPEGDAWEAWRIAIWSAEEFAMQGGDGALSRTQLAYLAGYGLLAPTSHNTVPERFELRPGGSQLGIWLDRRAVLAESDPTGRQAAISLGCVVANVEFAARSVGLDARVEVLDVPPDRLGPIEGDGDPHVAVVLIHLSPSAEPAVEWRGLMRRRKMVRAEYDQAIALPPTLAARLSSIVSEDAGLVFHLIEDGTTKLFLGKFQELADATVINREGFATELGDWLLENDDPSPLGMRGHEFGLSDDASRRFHRGLLGQVQLLPDEMAGFAKVGNIGMRSASAVGVITAAKDDLPHWIAAGRAYQRVALTLLSEDFVVAMHAGITEVTAPNMALRGRLRTRQRPVVVFRMGQPLRPEDGQRPHASRPPLASLVLP